jgi:hypothetical protein
LVIGFGEGLAMEGAKALEELALRSRRRSERVIVVGREVRR